MALQSLLGPDLFFSSVIIFYTDDRAPWASDKPVTRPLPTHRTTQTQNKRIHRNPYLEGDSNSRSQRSSERRQLTFTYFKNLPPKLQGSVLKVHIYSTHTDIPCLLNPCYIHYYLSVQFCLKSCFNARFRVAIRHLYGLLMGPWRKRFYHPWNKR
jgi:hypothetical protein